MLGITNQATALPAGIERWWGNLAVPDETNALGDPFTDSPVLLVAGAGVGVWGAVVPLCGTADVPVPATCTHYTMSHCTGIDMAGAALAWEFRVIYGTGTSTAAIVAGQYTEFMVLTDGTGTLAPFAVSLPAVPVGTKLWAQARDGVGGANMFVFFWGARGYPA